MNDGIALYRAREMSLVILVARKLGPPRGTFESMAIRIRAIMPIQSGHGILHHFGQRSGRFAAIGSHGAHGQVFGD